MFLSFVSFICMVIMLLLIYTAAIREDQNLENTSYGLFSGGFMIMCFLTGLEVFRDSNKVIFDYNAELK